MKKMFLFCVKKYQSVTHVLRFIFQGLFKDVVLKTEGTKSFNPMSFYKCMVT